MAQRRPMPPLNALRAFEAAARHLSFKEAAEELHVTPAAVSHQIRNLEDLVGMRLFERSPRAITLTAAGERFFPVLRDGFDRIAQSVADLRREGEAATLSVTPAFASLVLIPRLAEFRARYPDTRLTVDASERLADLRKSEADIAVRYGPERPTSFEDQLLFTDRYIVVASPGLVGDTGPPVPAHAIAAGQLLAYDWKNPALRGPDWAAWMTLAGIPRHADTRTIVFSEESHAVQAALDGAGTALVSSLLVAQHLRSGALLQVHPLSLPGFPYRAMFLPDHPRADLLRRIVAWLATLAHEPVQG